MISSYFDTQEIHQIFTVQVSKSVLHPNFPNEPVTLKYIIFRYINFVYDENTGEFHDIKFPSNLQYKEIHQKFGKGEQNPEEKTKIFGKNLINVPMPSIFSLLINELFTPFLIFQLFSCTLWFYEGYSLYAGTILFLTIILLSFNLYETRSNIQRVREMAHHESEVKIKRQNEWITESSSELVPGDIIQISEIKMLPSDVLLLYGTVIVDESMLTGESQPVVKDPLPNNSSQIFNMNKLHVLSSGTTPLYCWGDCYGVVISTGFMTTKGQLVRSILYPKPNRFKFTEDSIKYIGFMFIVAILGFCYCIAFFIEEGYGAVDLIVFSLDLITIAVPPILPLAMTVGVAFAITRLKNKSINCTSPPSVNSAGRVSVITFDKTGTLTEDFMSLKGGLENSEMTPDLSKCSPEFQENLASCHNLKIVNEKLLGDPQEIAIFESVKWVKEWTNPNYIATYTKDNKILGVKFVYQFSPLTKRMGVVVEDEAKTLKLHMKGAPEVILPLCEEVPVDIYEVISKYTRQGIRVLAFGSKEMSDFNPENALEDIEKGLKFIGIILLENPLKSDAARTLRILLHTNIRCLVSTGDAVLTGAAVAKKLKVVPKGTSLFIGDFSNNEIKWETADGEKSDWENASIADHYAISGRLLEKLVKEKHEHLEIVIKKGCVFGRMSPQQKVLLVQQLQTEDVQVAHVGDGANDCAALKAADVGLSLSDSESSIAAPFNGKELSGIIEILKEGRASLATSFQTFKYITMYSLAQFFTVVILYSLNNRLLDVQYLYQDLFIILPLVICMSYTKSYDLLAPYLPPGALISLPILSSTIGQTIFQLIVQVVSYIVLINQSWYETEETSVDDPVGTDDTTVLFIISSAQMIYMCLIYSIGPPFRQEVPTNFWFIGAIVVLVTVHFYISIFPDEYLKDFLGLTFMPYDFKMLLILIITVAVLISWEYENYGIKYFSKIKIID